MADFSLTPSRDSFGSRLPVAGVFSAFVAGMMALVVAGLVFGGLIILNKSRETQKQELISQNKIKEESMRPELLASILSLDKRLKAARSALSVHTFASNVFQLLEADTHPQVGFSNFSFAADSLKADMSGEAASYRVLARQISIFEQDPQIERVEFGGLSATGEGLVGFKLSVTFKPTLLRLRQ